MAFKKQLALQLYTVRDHTAKDFAGTLRQVAKIGYDGVELAGFGNSASPEEAAKAIKASGLKVAGAHVGIGELDSDFAGAVKKYATVGCQNIIVPWLPQEYRTNAAGWKTVAKKLSKYGKALKKEGFRLGYHNHSFEFALVSKGVTGMDILIEQSEAEYVSFELDCFWVVHGGKCPACFIRQHADRMMILHLKDMSDPQERKFANVGEGLLDFPGIVAAGTKAKVPWYIVEQDNCYEQDPLDAARVGYKNLKKMKLF